MCSLRRFWQSPVLHHCPHCCSALGHLPASWDTRAKLNSIFVFSSLQLCIRWLCKVWSLSNQLNMCFRILLSLLSESVLGKNYKHVSLCGEDSMMCLRWLVVTSFGLVAAGALGRTASLYKKTHTQTKLLTLIIISCVHIHFRKKYINHSFSVCSGLKCVWNSLCPLGNGSYEKQKDILNYFYEPFYLFILQYISLFIS